MKPYQYASIMSLLFYNAALINGGLILYAVSILWMAIAIIDLIPFKK